MSSTSLDRVLKVCFILDANAYLTVDCPYIAEMLAVEFFLVVYFVAVVWGAEFPNSTAPLVDLGYEVYQGYYNATSRVNIFKGVRYAAAPTGSLRWKKPQPPLVNRTEILNATEYPTRCPQSAETP